MPNSTKPIKEKEQFFDNEGEQEAIRFFENKAAPKYWQVCYDLLKSKSKSIALTIITCCFILTLPNTITAVSSEVIPFIQEQNALKADELKTIESDKIALLNDLNLAVIRNDLRSMRASYDEIYAKAQPYFIKLSNITSERSAIHSHNEKFNDDFNKTFASVFKLIAVLEAGTPSAYKTITNQEVLDAITTIRREKINNFGISHPSYNHLYLIVQKYQPK